MLWSSFTLSFLHASKYLSWTWSKITIADDHAVIKLRLSKRDPFRRGQSINIYSTNSFTCPVCALQLFAEKTGTTQSHQLVFSARNFSPLTPLKLT